MLMKPSTNLIYSRVSVYIVQLRNEGKIQGSFEVSKQIIRKARPQSLFREHCPFFSRKASVHWQVIHHIS